MLSRARLPALVAMENSTALPALSRKVSPSSRKPSSCSLCNALDVSYGCGLRLLLNQNLLLGEMMPMAGTAWPRKTIRARSPRLMASEIARRKFVEVNQAFLYAARGEPGAWLNQSCSVSVEAPASRTNALSADSFSKMAGDTVLIR